jgi:hypothetical protein
MIRKFCFLMVLILSMLKIFCQDTTMKKKEYYLEKNRQQKKVGWILLGAGTAMAVGGAIAFSNYYVNGTNRQADVAGIIMLTGVVADIVSIGFFVIAGNNKERAAELSFRNEHILIPQPNGFALSAQPAINLSIPFRFR